MRLLLAAIAAIASTLVSAAPARAVPSSATLATPARVEAVITDGGMWHCAGTTCSGTASGGRRQQVAVCSAVAAAAGRVDGFTAAGDGFNDADLLRCNRHVKAMR